MFILKSIDVCNINCVTFLTNEKLTFLISISKNLIKITCVKNFGLEKFQCYLNKIFLNWLIVLSKVKTNHHLKPGVLKKL